jgi:hypothetical protein
MGGMSRGKQGFPKVECLTAESAENAEKSQKNSASSAVSAVKKTDVRNDLPTSGKPWGRKERLPIGVGHDTIGSKLGNGCEKGKKR